MKLASNEFMNTREIAEATGVPRQTVLDAINRVLPGRTQQGRTAYFNEIEVGMISEELKRAHNFTSTREVTLTRYEKAKIVEQARKIIEQELEDARAELERARPKIEFFDAVADSKDAIDMGQAAKVLDMGVGRNKLFEILRQTGILRDNNEPYQRYIDAEWFRCIEQRYTRPDGSVQINIKTLVYQRGLDAIRRIIEKAIREGKINA